MKAKRKKLQQEYEIFKLKKYGNEMIKKNLDILLYSLKDLDEDVENNPVNKDTFAKIIEKGSICNNYQVTFKFKCGIEREMSAKRTNKQ